LVNVMNVRVLDMRGLQCPEPLIRIVKVIEGLGTGDVVDVVTDVPECVNLIKEAVEGFGLGLVEVLNKGEYFVLRVLVR